MLIATQTMKRLILLLFFRYSFCVRLSPNLLETGQSVCRLSWPFARPLPPHKNQNYSSNNATQKILRRYNLVRCDWFSSSVCFCQACMLPPGNGNCTGHGQCVYGTLCACDHPYAYYNWCQLAVVGNAYTAYSVLRWLALGLAVFSFVRLGFVLHSKLAQRPSGCSKFGVLADAQVQALFCNSICRSRPHKVLLFWL